MRRSELALLCVVLLGACDAEPAPHRGGRPGATHTRTRGNEPTPLPELDYVERVVGGARASDRLPTLVAIHGLGDTPEAFVELFAALPVPMRVVAPRAPHAWSEGSAWMTTRVRDGDETELGREVASSTEALVRLLERLRTRPDVDGRLLVSGFSQGGILTYAVTTARPDLVRAAFPIAGLLPRAQLDALRRAPAPAPPILALHGAADRTVPYDRDVVLVERLRALGWPVELATFADVRHVVPDVVRARLYAAIEGALRPTR